MKLAHPCLEQIQLQKVWLFQIYQKHLDYLSLNEKKKKCDQSHLNISDLFETLIPWSTIYFLINHILLDQPYTSWELERNFYKN